MDLHRAAVPLDFTAITPSRRLVSLPPTPGNKSRWWNEASDWREGRLAPGGRGMLDVRMSRATRRGPPASIPAIGVPQGSPSGSSISSSPPRASWSWCWKPASSSLKAAVRRGGFRDSQAAHSSRAGVQLCTSRSLRASRAHFRHPDPARPWRRVVTPCRRFHAR